ncbi:MAG: DUF4261 domain-containing protein [Cytophagales bacterium]|nr:DUF4261 domain-containing protein [Armatimonadota bacterium]
MLLPFPGGASGQVIADSFAYPWPDDMGDPQTAPDLFAGWTMGQFGPLTFPRALERAARDSVSWSDAVGDWRNQHTGVVRLRSQGFAAAGGHPVDELAFVTEAALALLELLPDSALCYFNPAGELLLPTQAVRESLDRFRGGGAVPLEIWCGTRVFRIEAPAFDLGETLPPQVLVDTVGLGQLNLPDHEVRFSDARFAIQEVQAFLLNTAAYQLKNGPVIRAGDTINGPGGVSWRMSEQPNSLLDPPRRGLLSWQPVLR